MKMFRLSLLTLIMLAFTVGAYAQDTGEPPRDAPYDEVTADQRRIIPYDHLREADVFWRKRVWRVIEVNEKMNLPFKYPKAPLINILRDLALEGTITVYNPGTAGDSFEEMVPYTTAEAASLGVPQADTIFVINPVTGEEEREITDPIFDPLKVKKFRLKEDWIFDEETSTLIVRIIGIAPIMEMVDDQGNVRGDLPLFWAYYPELRPHLAKHDAFNPKNGAQQMSWEDVFEMRYFDSYVIKEDNVYDRRIEDYTSGIDALLEAERVENDIFIFEHDLWSY